MRTRSQENKKLSNPARRSTRLHALHKKRVKTYTSSKSPETKPQGSKVAPVSFVSTDFLAENYKEVLAKYGEGNKILEGILKEVRALAVIQTSGIPGTPLTGKMDVELFGKTPNFSALGKSNGAILFRPRAYNYMAIDAIVAHKFDRQKEKVIHLYPIQITINKHHSKSVDIFFRKWAPIYLKELFHKFPNHTIKFVFVWIDTIEARPSMQKMPLLLQCTYPRTLVADFPVIHVPIDEFIQ